MPLTDLLPASWRKGGETKPPSGSDSPPSPPPATSTLQPTLQVVSSYGTPPHDQVLTDKIIGMVTETVPSIKDLLAEAKKIEATVSDLGTRLNIVMSLKGFTPAQASDAVVALTRALDSVGRQSEGDISGARTEQVERPKQRVSELTTRKQTLLDEIAGIDREAAEANERATQAEVRIQAEEAKLKASVAQAKAWIDSLARLITKS